MEQPDVYFLAVIPSYRTTRHPVPINTIVVHARTLLNSSIPQPDGSNIYRCLTAFPGRSAGEIVPLSTLTMELAGGRNWSEIGDWEQVIISLAHLVDIRGCDSLEMGLHTEERVMVSHAPGRPIDFHWSDGTPSRRAEPWERRRFLECLEAHVQQMVLEGGPFWPGRDLVAAGPYPSVEIYAPADMAGVPLRHEELCVI